MQLSTGNVYTFKLNSGEELVTKVIKTDSEWITVEDPVSIAPGPQGMGLVPRRKCIVQTQTTMNNMMRNKQDVEAN